MIVPCQGVSNIYVQVEERDSSDNESYPLLVHLLCRWSPHSPHTTFIIFLVSFSQSGPLQKYENVVDVPAPVLLFLLLLLNT